MIKDLNGHISKENLKKEWFCCTACRQCVERHPTSLATSERDIKSTRRCHLIPARMVIARKQDERWCSEGSRRIKSLLVCDWSVKGLKALGRQLNHSSTRGLGCSIPMDKPRGNENSSLYSLMFTAKAFLIVKMWKESKALSIYKQMMTAIEYCITLK